jgi:hypothetical protein
MKSSVLRGSDVVRVDVTLAEDAEDRASEEAKHGAKKKSHNKGWR